MRHRSLRVQANANFTLASVMDQEGHYDQIFEPAQAARNYYQKHGYLVMAALSVGNVATPGVNRCPASGF